jgi:hypothetical protein
MILARESRAVLPAPVAVPLPPAPAGPGRVTELREWAAPVLLVIALLLAVAVPLTLALPSLTAPTAERVIVIDGSAATVPGGH